MEKRVTRNAPSRSSGQASLPNARLIAISEALARAYVNADLDRKTRTILKRPQQHVPIEEQIQGSLPRKSFAIDLGSLSKSLTPSLRFGTAPSR